MAGISITCDREVEIDFSYPHMNTGRQILTFVGGDPGWLPVVRSLTTTATLELLGSLLAFVVLSAHVLFVVESKEAPTSVTGTSRGPSNPAGAFWQQSRPSATGT